MKPMITGIPVPDRHTESSDVSLLFTRVKVREKWKFSDFAYLDIPENRGHREHLPLKSEDAAAFRLTQTRLQAGGDA